MSEAKKEISIGLLLILVFLPAILVMLLYIGALQVRNTIPPLLSYTVIGLLVLLPFEAIVILRASKKETGKYNLTSAFVYNSKIPLKRFLITTVISFCITGTVATLIGNAEFQWMRSTVFKSVPAYWMLENFASQTQQYPAALILTTCILYFFTNALVLPVIEELYFRGYLMPRIERFGILAPILITVLFSLYHFWAPWSNIMRIFAIFPYTYAVYKNKNIYIGIFVHCAINIFSSLSLLCAVYWAH